MATVTIVVTTPESIPGLEGRLNFHSDSLAQSHLNLANFFAGMANGSQDSSSTTVNVA